MSLSIDSNEYGICPVPITSQCQYLLLETHKDILFLTLICRWRVHKLREFRNEKNILLNKKSMNIVLWRWICCCCCFCLGFFVCFLYSLNQNPHSYVEVGKAFLFSSAKKLKWNRKKKKKAMVKIIDINRNTTPRVLSDLYQHSSKCTSRYGHYEGPKYRRSALRF